MEKAGRQNSQNVNFQLWQQDNHPIELFDQKISHQKLNYIHNNPVTAGIVENPEEYLYSSAKDYYGQKGLLEITMVAP
ncbi:MAG: transposase, partial [Mucilaginibacter sp.]|nr:transposase [Mucilaginibacter sp.]